MADDAERLRENWVATMAGWMLEILGSGLSIQRRLHLTGVLRRALLEGLNAYIEASGGAGIEVTLDKIGSNKIEVIKAVRAATALGLKEAKELVESAPVTIKARLTREEAESLKARLEEAGGTASVKGVARGEAEGQ